MNKIILYIPVFMISLLFSCSPVDLMSDKIEKTENYNTVMANYMNQYSATLVKTLSLDYNIFVPDSAKTEHKENFLQFQVMSRKYAIEDSTKLKNISLHFFNEITPEIKNIEDIKTIQIAFIKIGHAWAIEAVLDQNSTQLSLEDLKVVESN